MKSKIIISGPQASGKTHIALAMRSLFDKEEVLWLTPPHNLQSRFRNSKPKLIVIDECKDVESARNIMNKIEMRWENTESISVVFQTSKLLSQRECLEFTLIKTFI